MYDKPENATLSRRERVLLDPLGASNRSDALDEATVRDMVGAPTELEDQYCVCGELLEECDEGYVHMTSGA